MFEKNKQNIQYVKVSSTSECAFICILLYLWACYCRFACYRLCTCVCWGCMCQVVHVYLYLSKLVFALDNFIVKTVLFNMITPSSNQIFNTSVCLNVQNHCTIWSMIYNVVVFNVDHLLNQRLSEIRLKEFDLLGHVTYITSQTICKFSG